MSKPMAIAITSTRSGWPNKPPVRVPSTASLVCLGLGWKDRMQVVHEQENKLKLYGLQYEKNTG